MGKSSRTKTPYAVLTAAIVILSLILIFMVLLIFCPPFTRAMLRVPVVKNVTNALVGNIYNTDSGGTGGSRYSASSDAGRKKGSSGGGDSKSRGQVTILPVAERANMGYIDSCVFLGDSRTVAMSTYGLIPERLTLAQTGLSHMDAETTTYTYLQSGLTTNFSTFMSQHSDAEVVYIGYGVNGIAYTDETEYKDSYTELVSDVIERMPRARVVIASILPVKEGYAATAGTTNAQIDSYNTFLYNLARNLNIYYLDVASVCKGNDGGMADEYNVGDGLHYNEEGCRQILKYILTHPVPDVTYETVSEDASLFETASEDASTISGR